MELKYDIGKYITATRMSSKKRVLVEGKDDRAHIKNLLDILEPDHKIKIDISVDIKGNCKKTATNNRAKIEKIHQSCKESDYHKNLFFLCDREFRGFEILDTIIDNTQSHERDGNLSWTLGHSIENYFISEDMLAEGYRYLCESGYKTEALKLFKLHLNSAIKIISATTLAAKDINKSTYPSGVISWKNFTITADEINLSPDHTIQEPIYLDLFQRYDYYLPVVNSSDNIICSRICRGHTAMLLLQRFFSACLYHVLKPIDENTALADANAFSKISESHISTALSEAWVKKVGDGKASFPEPLIYSVIGRSMLESGLGL